jgi:hypothetical protein
MSREIAQDFQSFLSFFGNYKLPNLTANKDFVEVLSKQHKKYFSYLNCVGELTFLSQEGALTPPIHSSQILFITESCSDIGSALFVMTHGAYKASRMMLRSSIETFLKGFNLDALPDLDKDKSVYSIFDQVKALDFFKEELTKDLFDKIHLIYIELCRDTHTASENEMKQITALKYFPHFHIDEATSISTLLMNLSAYYTALICIKYSEYFHKMHHKSKENMIENIPREYRRAIHGI